MFYSLTGKVTEIGQNNIVLDVGGIGFLLNTSLQTISSLEIGNQVRLFVSESIGENNFDLYAFSELKEKHFFELLISVSGVGPKVAISLLSSQRTDSLVFAIVNDDVKSLSSAPGVGKKIAQRIILELRDKLGVELSSLGTSGISNTTSQLPSVPNKAVADAIAGLNVLGYSTAEVSAIIQRSDWTGMTSEQIIREVLKNMV